MVCWITRGPAKPIRASGSAISTSVLVAKDAATPPYVGSVISVTVSSPASCTRAMAWLVFAICISDRQPSCIRAPPDAVTMSSGSPRSRASSAVRVTSSPTAEPRLPPMNRKSMTASATWWPPMLPSPQTTASSSPVLRRLCASRRG